MGPKTKTAPADPIEPGLHLVIGEGGAILRSAPIRNAPRRVLQPPFIGPRTLKDIQKPLTEVVLDLLRGDGRLLDSFGWPWTSEAFYDRAITAVLQEMTIGRIEARQTIRILRVPVPRSATFLLFSESRVTLGVPRSQAISRIGLALYSLVSPTPPLPRLPDFAQGLEAKALPGRAPLVRPL